MASHDTQRPLGPIVCAVQQSRRAAATRNRRRLPRPPPGQRLRQGRRLRHGRRPRQRRARAQHGAGGDDRLACSRQHVPRRRHAQLRRQRQRCAGWRARRQPPDLVGRPAPRQHTHPFVQPTTGGSGSATIPVRGEISDNIFYRFHLRATDSAGATHEVTRDVHAAKGPGHAGHAARRPAAHARRPADHRAAHVHRRGRHRARPRRRQPGLQLPQLPVQQLERRRYAATHTISTPAANTTYTATFIDQGPAGSAPTVSLTAPANGSTGTVGTPITLTATAADSDGSDRQRAVLRRRHRHRRGRHHAPLLGELDTGIDHRRAHADRARHRQLRHRAPPAPRCR